MTRKKKPVTRRRNEEREEEEIEEVEDLDIELYTDGLIEEKAPAPLLLSDEHEQQTWSGFFSSLVCGAAASSGGEVVNLRLCALEADAMLREYRARIRCASCGGTFTGVEKEALTECRACGAPRRT